MKELFTKYYQNNTWGEPETPSGFGSTIEHTKNLVAYIPTLITKYDIQSILDAPCGDYHWFKFVYRTIPYIGADIVESLISLNNEVYKNDITNFVCLDITTDELPKADLVICRDCLIHFSDEDIRKFLDNFKRSGNKYLLTTNAGIGQNTNIETGGHRFINLHAPPFNFGLPLEVFSEWTWDTYPPKTLNLYHKDSIK